MAGDNEASAGEVLGTSIGWMPAAGNDGLDSPVEILIQAYFDRWEIEVNHREEKSLFGVGDAQVWSEQAAPRVPHYDLATGVPF